MRTKLPRNLLDVIKGIPQEVWRLRLHGTCPSVGASMPQRWNREYRLTE